MGTTAALKAGERVGWLAPEGERKSSRSAGDGCCTVRASRGGGEGVEGGGGGSGQAVLKRVCGLDVVILESIERCCDARRHEPREEAMATGSPALLVVYRSPNISLTSPLALPAALPPVPFALTPSKIVPRLLHVSASSSPTIPFTPFFPFALRPVPALASLTAAK